MFFIPTLREKIMNPKVMNEYNFYNKYSKEEIEVYQLQQFNKKWKSISQHVPFYKRLVEQNELPTYFSTIDEFYQLPIVNRERISSDIYSFTNQEKKADSWGTTGGSTGNPLQFPKWKSETNFTEPSVWYVRSFYGIRRSDKMFRLWGHSHTMGEGLSRVINKVKFGIGLPLVGYKRFSAYDLSEEKLREAGEQILEFEPKYIVGYSKALYLLAKANVEKKEAFHQLKLKAVIGAAEGFDSELDKDYVSDVFGCPVALQYAAMETNYIAHTQPNDSYEVLWRNNLIECVDEKGNPAETGRILITSLYPRAFPLIRYELGDVISGCKKDGISVYSFDEVKGRDNDFLILEDGTPIHSEGITHAIKLSEKIAGYQIRYTKDRVYTIYLRSHEKINEQDINAIRERLKQVDPRLAGLKIKQVNELKQTLAGKTKWLMEE